MAGKFTVALLLFFFAVAHARSPADLPESDLTVLEASDFPESDPKAARSTILLPSENHDSDPFAESDRESGSRIPEIESEGASEMAEAEPMKEETKESETATEVPLTFITFRPVNRRFRHHPLLHIRRGRPCRHHWRPWSARFDGRGIPYGKDMILSGGGEHQIPARWEKFRQGRFSLEHEFPDFHRDERRHHHHHHHHHHRHMELEEEEREEREHGHGHGGFMWKIRKFLDRF